MVARLIALSVGRRTIFINPAFIVSVESTSTKVVTVTLSNGSPLIVDVDGGVHGFVDLLNGERGLKLEIGA